MNLQLSLLHIQQVDISHRFEQTGNAWWYVAKVQPRPTRCYSIPADREQTQWRATGTRRLALVAERYAAAGAETDEQRDAIRCTRSHWNVGIDEHTEQVVNNGQQENYRSSDQQLEAGVECWRRLTTTARSVLTRALVKISCSSQHQLNFWSNYRQLQVIQQTTHFGDNSFSHTPGSSVVRYLKSERR